VIDFYFLVCNIVITVLLVCDSLLSTLILVSSHRSVGGVLDSIDRIMYPIFRIGDSLQG
jgi:hypothetical protein